MERYVRVQIDVDDKNERRCDPVLCAHCLYSRDFDDSWTCDIFMAKHEVLHNDAKGRPIRCRACLAAERAAKGGKS